MKWALSGLVLAACAPDPCAEGMAYTADGVGYATIREGWRPAAALDNVVYVCPGTHKLATTIVGNDAIEGLTTPVVRGAETGDSVLVPQTWKNFAFADAPLTLLVESLFFADSEAEGLRDLITMNDGGSGEDRVTPFDEEGEPDGALNVWGNITFENVTFTRNRGYWGGAVSVWRDQDATITFTGCTFSDNEAIDGTSGGAVLVYYDPLENGGKPTSNRVTIVSEDTDWASGDDDNGPDDLAFASSNGDQYNPHVTVDASYRFDGVASFTCSGETQTCE